jgi:hypothetical protein
MGQEQYVLNSHTYSVNLFTSLLHSGGDSQIHAWPENTLAGFSPHMEKDISCLCHLVKGCLMMQTYLQSHILLLLMLILLTRH